MPTSSRLENKAPTKSAVKVKMIEWLSKNQILFFETMRKSELLELINKHKPVEKKYKIDRLNKALWTPVAWRWLFCNRLLILFP